MRQVLLVHLLYQYLQMLLVLLVFLEFQKDYYQDVVGVELPLRHQELMVQMELESDPMVLQVLVQRYLVNVMNVELLRQQKFPNDFGCFHLAVQLQHQSLLGWALLF